MKQVLIFSGIGLVVVAMGIALAALIAFLKIPNSESDWHPTTDRIDLGGHEEDDSVTHLAQAPVHALSETVPD